jgi:L-alanine-DL-glutamate epimerase-like enolase superfamily enzyme
MRDGGINARVDHLRIHRLRLPLRQPYKLSFGPVEAFDTILVELEMNGRRGFGDATVLTGYTEETIEGAWSLACRLAPRLAGCQAPTLWAETEPHLAEAPFTVTAFRTAAEMALGHRILKSPAERQVPLLKILNADTEPDIVAEVEAGLAAGYGTFKIKVGFDLEPDLARVAFIQHVVAGRAALTIDANQGYTTADGCAFAARVGTESVLFFEQACDKHDWEAAVAVARAARTPVMLDEQIYDLEDVRQAAALDAAGFVKLKLMKMGGLEALIDGIAATAALGLSPVLGNGVATDIGCWMEACVAAGRIRTAGEMNGFLKPVRPIVRNPMPVRDGALIVPANYWPEIDPDAVAAFALDSVVPELA